MRPQIAHSKFHGGEIVSMYSASVSVRGEAALLDWRPACREYGVSLTLGADWLRSELDPFCREDLRLAGFGVVALPFLLGRSTKRAGDGLRDLLR